jgi:hypothetical protein
MYDKCGFGNHKNNIQTTNYIFVSCDEAIDIDNQSWIFVHGYVVEDFKRIPILLNLEQVKWLYNRQPNEDDPKLYPSFWGTIQLRPSYKGCVFWCKW